MGTGYFLRDERLYRPLSLHVTSIGRYSTTGQMLPFIAGPAFTGNSWPANNRAIYVPIAVPAQFTVARFFVGNSNATGNVDLGLYTFDGTRLISTGSTARAGTNVVQYIDVTNQSFPAGSYYLAMVLSTTSGSVLASGGPPIVAELQTCGILQEDLGATALPATMSPAAYTSLITFGFGFTQSDTL